MFTLCELAKRLSPTDRQALAQLLARAIHRVAPREPVVEQVRESNIEELSDKLFELEPRQLQEFVQLIG